MHVSNFPLHVYRRTLQSGQQDSLSEIASLIKPGQSILDLGMGTGALGQFLTQRFSVLVDGVTINPEEADAAKAFYRQIRICDLDTAILSSLFANDLYDAIVCADVLEHLKAPENLLAQCRTLLKLGGQLITSVPNVGYCGLIADLVQGEFLYRSEGLLDRTHLRFFTRQSLMRFFQDNGWMPNETRSIERALVDSEFEVQFDSLPPAVARYFLAMPDALTYQFVTTLSPISVLSADVNVRQAQPLPNGQRNGATAGFTAELYLEIQHSYQEKQKLTAKGTIGESDQWLTFDIPPCGQPYTALRLDPADRPGYFRLRQIRIQTYQSTEPVWCWDAQRNDPEELSLTAHQQILFQNPWPLLDAVLLFLYGDDPWLELPVPRIVLDSIAKSGARLEMQVGWPMSADYAQAADATNRALAKLSADIAQRDSHIGDIALELKELQVLRMQLEHRIVQAERAAFEQAEQTERLAREQAEQTERLAREQAGEAERLAAQQAVQVRAFTLALQESRRNENHSRREVHDLRAQTEQMQEYLQSIETSTVFKVTRPLVNLKMKFDRLRDRGSSSLATVNNDACPETLPRPSHPVDIVIPVYRGFQDTRRCIESVLAADCQTAWRLIVINDCSPEPELVAWLQTLERVDIRITFLQNTENLGFVATVNRGMALSGDRDVLLLNSDTEVANDWLDRLQCAAYSAPMVASVTPFSNNATICSYPRFCQPSDLPLHCTTQAMDQLFAQNLSGQTLEIPTGVGFCMYVRRQCLLEVGLFDVDNFGKGYGEENDFCVRASNAGWSNLHALDVFVRHVGGISFGESKSEREIQAMETLSRLHPQYEMQVQKFVKLDPARLPRLKIDLARITSGTRPVILNVTHNREGGTLRHIQELAIHLADKAVFLRLTPAVNGGVLTLEGAFEAFKMHFNLPQEFSSLVTVLKSLQVGHIHFQHVLGHLEQTLELPRVLGVTYDCTVHDYFTICPQISLTDHTDHYCQEEGIEQCRKCLQRNPAPNGSSIEHWRQRHAALVNGARYVIAPSHDVAIRMRRYLPTANICVEPHAELIACRPSAPRPVIRPLPANRPLVVVVLGALSKIKGADVLEAVASLAADKQAKVEFHLLGYAYRNLKTQPRAKLTVHGQYVDADLPLLLEWLKPDVVWFPAIWPETYSYTLSACIENGLPVVAPNIGAFSERIHGREWSWLCDWQTSPQQWLDFFCDIRETNFLTGIPPKQPETLRSHDIDDDFSYQGSYLAGLNRPVPLSRDDITAVLAIFQHLQPNFEQPAKVIKSSALAAIMRLRATVLLSPLAKLVPMHTQRRVKSWLRR